MNLPPSSDPKWRAIITGEAKFPFEFLAVKVFMGRVGMELAKDSSAGKVQAFVAELRTLFEKNAQLPSAQRDLQKIFG